MTSQPIRDPVTDQLLTPQNAALIVIDFQPVQIASVAAMDRRVLVHNSGRANLATFRLRHCLSA